MVYLLSESAGEIRWSDWRKLGGCSLSMQAEVPLQRYYYQRRQRFEKVNPPLKEIARISNLAGLEIARYAQERLNLEGFVVPAPGS